MSLEVAMHVLVTWGSKRGGTAGIGRIIADTLAVRGFEVVACAASEAPSPAGFDAVILGGALYANRWHPAARHYARRHLRALRRVPVWLFSSGPLDDSADRGDLAAIAQVATLRERIGALGHVTFGGRLEPDAQGAIASAMARTHSGDWRNPDLIRAWTQRVADALPAAHPGVAHEPAARALPRLFAHAATGWAICAAIMMLQLAFGNAHTAAVTHALLVPFVFGIVAWHYFEPAGARGPFATAVWFAAVVAVLDLVFVGGLVLHSFAIARSFAGFRLPLFLIFIVTWVVGGLRSTMPWPSPALRTR
jgi:menaquinone-dependent protoporphyrinogen oxidase